MEAPVVDMRYTPLPWAEEAHRHRDKHQALLLPRRAGKSRYLLACAGIEAMREERSRHAVITHLLARKFPAEILEILPPRVAMGVDDENGVHLANGAVIYVFRPEVAADRLEAWNWSSVALDEPTWHIERDVLDLALCATTGVGRVRMAGSYRKGHWFVDFVRDALVAPREGWFAMDRNAYELGGHHAKCADECKITMSAQHFEAEFLNGRA